MHIYVTEFWVQKMPNWGLWVFSWFPEKNVHELLEGQILMIMIQEDSKFEEMKKNESNQ